METEPYTVIDGRGAMSVFEIYIKTTPERLWEAITDPELRAKYSFGVGTESEWTAGLRLRVRSSGSGDPDRNRRDPRDRPAEAAGAELHRVVERRGEGRGTVEGHVGDRAGRHLLPAQGYPRRALRRRQQRALRRLADDPVRPQDVPGDGRPARHPGLAAVRGGRENAELDNQGHVRHVEVAERLARACPQPFCTSASGACTAFGHAAISPSRSSRSISARRPPGSAPSARAISSPRRAPLQGGPSTTLGAPRRASAST